MSLSHGVCRTLNSYRMCTCGQFKNKLVLGVYSCPWHHFTFVFIVKSIAGFANYILIAARQAEHSLRWPGERHGQSRTTVRAQSAPRTSPKQQGHRGPRSRAVVCRAQRPSAVRAAELAPSTRDEALQTLAGRAPQRSARLFSTERLSAKPAAADLRRFLFLISIKARQLKAAKN